MDSPRETSPELAYAPRGRWRWRLSRRYIIGGLVAAGAIGAWRWSDDVARVAETAYWSRQCLDYAPPADQVVFEQDAGEIGRLMGSGGGYQLSRPGEGDPPHAWVSPAVYARIPQSGWAPRVAFMHGLRSPGGAQRLVVVEFLAMREPQSPRHTVFFHPRVFSASAFTPGRQVLRNEDTVRIALAAGERLRLYAGRSDPRDPSRFTIDCVVAGERGTIEGRLRDDDVVTFRPLSGDALKQRWRRWDRSSKRPWWDARADAPHTRQD